MRWTNSIYSQEEDIHDWEGCCLGNNWFKTSPQVWTFPNRIVILQVKLHITITIIMATIYEGNLASFLCNKYLWVNDVKIIWQPRNIIWLIPERNNMSNINPDRIIDNPKSRNLKAFRNDFDIYWEHLLLKLHKVSLVGITRVSFYSVKDDQNWDHHSHEVLQD